ncbi:MAG TPA: dirigent protein [Steroidobacteraceae bacterium]|nr:dirigent protein [Steroidobacteraceae bacterium]
MSGKVAFIAAAGAALVSVGAQAGNSIAVVEHAATDAVTDTGAPGDTVGDLLTFANPVFDAANKKQVGTDQGYCIRTEVGKAWECFWTISLADGQITVEGPFLDKGDSTLAVTGGTGKYAGARGQMKLHARDEKGSEYDFAYELQ